MKTKLLACGIVAVVCAATLFAMRKEKAPIETGTSSSKAMSSAKAAATTITSAPPSHIQKTVNGIIVTLVKREATDAERLMEAKIWEFSVQMPNDQSSFISDLELWRNDKLVRRLTGSAAGPAVSASGKRDLYNLIVGLYPPSGSWDSGKVKALCALKTPNGHAGTGPRVVDFPVAQGGSIWGAPEFDEKRQAFLLMIVGGNQKNNVTWPMPQRDDYALYLRIGKKFYRASKI